MAFIFFPFSNLMPVHDTFASVIMFKTVSLSLSMIYDIVMKMISRCFMPDDSIYEPILPAFAEVRWSKRPPGS